MSQSQNSKLSKLTRENSTTVCRAVPKILAFLPLHLGVYREKNFLKCAQRAKIPDY
jgi:hypothetical protein